MELFPKGSTATIFASHGKFYKVETINYNTRKLTKGFVLKSKVIKGKETIFKFINSNKPYFNFSAMSVKYKLTVFSNQEWTEQYKSINNAKYNEFEVVTFNANKYVIIAIEDQGKVKEVYVEASSVYVQGSADVMY